MKHAKRSGGRQLVTVFAQASLLAVEHCTVPWEERPRASSRDQSGSKLPHSRAPAARKPGVLNGRFACFQGSRGEIPALRWDVKGGAGWNPWLVRGMRQIPNNFLTCPRCRTCYINALGGEGGGSAGRCSGPFLRTFTLARLGSLEPTGKQLEQSWHLKDD